MVVTRRRAATAVLRPWQQPVVKKEMKPKATKKTQSPAASPKSGSGCGGKRRAIRPIDRKKMRTWIVEKLRARDMPDHLWWVEPENTFAVKWPHAARHGFQVEDASLFRAWAEHSGIYKPGDEEDHKKWKSNFRCALRSVPDIKEVTKKDQRKGQKAARIYQLLDEPRERKIKHENPKRHIHRFVVREEVNQTSDESEGRMDTEDSESDSSWIGSGPALSIPVPGPQDCNIPDFSRLGLSTSGLVTGTCIQANHLSGGSYQEMKPEPTTSAVTPTASSSTTAAAASFPIPSTTFHVSIPIPVPVPFSTVDSSFTISSPTTSSAYSCSEDMLNEMRPVGIVTRTRSPSGDSGHPASPIHEDLELLEDGCMLFAIDDSSDEGIVLIDQIDQNISCCVVASEDNWTPARTSDLLDISGDTVPVPVLTEEVETCTINDFDLTSLQETV